MKEPKKPGQYDRRILLCITGMTPQIVTETLYALAHQEERFIPTEIHLITTSDGEKRINDTLLRKPQGELAAMSKDYPELGNLEECTKVHVIRGADGAPLPDIRTVEDNETAANFIVKEVAKYTGHENAALHVSIAGGRKTMGFLLGYAVSVFARPQDRLSHVLVSPPEFESPGLAFYYPPKKPRELALNSPPPKPRELAVKKVSTARAQITLAPIPLVRLRPGLPKDLLDGSKNYVETVRALDESLKPASITVDLARNEVVCGGHKVRKLVTKEKVETVENAEGKKEDKVTVTVKVQDLEPVEVAWAGFWAQAALGPKPFRHWSEINADEFLPLYACALGVTSAKYMEEKNRIEKGTSGYRGSSDALRGVGNKLLSDERKLKDLGDAILSFIDEEGTGQKKRKYCERHNSILRAAFDYTLGYSAVNYFERRVDKKIIEKEITDDETLKPKIDRKTGRPKTVKKKNDEVRYGLRVDRERIKVKGMHG